MKKVMVLAAALALAAAPAAAQESASAGRAVQARSAVVSTAVAPSLFVSQDEIRQRVAAAETGRESVQMNNNFLYTVAAVALGVIIAFLILD